MVPLEFCPFLLPEFVFIGHEVFRNGNAELPKKHGVCFDLIQKIRATRVNERSKRSIPLLTLRVLIAPLPSRL